jgi:hypothetical protein
VSRPSKYTHSDEFSIVDEYGPELTSEEIPCTLAGLETTCRRFYVRNDHWIYLAAAAARSEGVVLMCSFNGADSEPPAPCTSLLALR